MRFMLAAAALPLLLAAGGSADLHRVADAAADRVANRVADRVAGAAADPAAEAAALLAHDRALGARNTLGVAAALAAALAPDAIMPAPGRGFAEGRAEILTLFARDTLNATSRLAWTPVRAGVSADGTHGLTIGLLTVTRATGQLLEFKYLAYWVRGAEGWQMRVFRRVPRAAGSVDASPAAPWLPDAGAASTPLAADAHEAARRVLQGMEQVFSDSAARIGIGPAFAALGAADAWHLGGPADPAFNRGNAAIARAVQGDAPAGSSPVIWNAEWAILAPSGDLGVTMGYIVPKQPGPDGQRPRFPFFTIWRREAGGWKYIAE